MKLLWRWLLVLALIFVLVYFFVLPDSSDNLNLKDHNPYSQTYQSELDREITSRQQGKYRIKYSIAGLKDTLDKHFLMLYVKSINLKAIMPLDISKTEAFIDIQLKEAKGWHHAVVKGLEFEYSKAGFKYISHRWIAD